MVAALLVVSQMTDIFEIKAYSPAGDMEMDSRNFRTADALENAFLTNILHKTGG